MTVVLFASDHEALVDDVACRTGRMTGSENALNLGTGMGEMVNGAVLELGILDFGSGKIISVGQKLSSVNVFG